MSTGAEWSLPAANHAATAVGLLLEIVRRNEGTGNLASAAQIVALCVEHRVRELLTADRDFARFSKIKLRAL